jgi:murein DD-endopeptidase MepM/ murein hydrolase activator NlpD
MRSCLKPFLALVLLAISAHAADIASFRSISWTPAKVAPGSPCLFRVQMSAEPVSLIGEWQGHELTFVPSTDHSVWYGLAGVDVEAAPGNDPLALTATLAGGTVLREERMVEVAPASYPTEKLRVPQKYVQPDPETLKRIEVDKQLKKVAFDHQTTTAEWSGDFRPPIDTTVSEGFGTRRTFNGKLASIHRGLDYHAAPGTPVRAANSGEVVLAHELFYEGNCVVVDHGLGFMTIYMHLSQLKVSEGQHVEKGQEVGLSGATGRATGPHLHVAARWQGAYLDPAQLWTLRLPDLSASTESAGQAER